MLMSSSLMLFPTLFTAASGSSSTNLLSGLLGVLSTLSLILWYVLFLFWSFYMFGSNLLFPVCLSGSVSSGPCCFGQKRLSSPFGQCLPCLQTLSLWAWSDLRFPIHLQTDPGFLSPTWEATYVCLFLVISSSLSPELPFSAAKHPAPDRTPSEATPSKVRSVSFFLMQYWLFIFSVPVSRVSLPQPLPPTAAPMMNTRSRWLCSLLRTTSPQPFFLVIPVLYIPLLSLLLLVFWLLLLFVRVLCRWTTMQTLHLPNLHLLLPLVRLPLPARFLSSLALLLSLLNPKHSRLR